MKWNQGSYTAAVLAGLIAGGGMLAASAYAVSADKPAAAPRCEAHHGQQAESHRDARRAGHLAELKQKLKLGAEQESAWNTFAEAIQPGPRPGMDRQAMREAYAKLNTPQRIDRMLAMSDMHRARMLERAEAIKAFYAQLSPEQQSVFDAEAMPGRHAHGHHAPRYQS